MNADSYLNGFHTGLDEIVQREFDFSGWVELFPDASALSILERAEVIRGFTRERHEFHRRIPIEEATDFSVESDIKAVDDSKSNVIRSLIDGEESRQKLVAIGNSTIAGMNDKTPHFEMKDQLAVAVGSGDDERLVWAMSHLFVHSNDYAQMIRDELSELTGAALERRRAQFHAALTDYQEAKSNVVGRCFSGAMLVALNYGKGSSVRDLAVASMNGLAKAIEKFDQKRGFEFGKYSSWWIRQAVTFTVLELSGWTIREVELRSMMRKVLGDSWSSWLRTPEPKDVAELGLSDEEVLSIARRTLEQMENPTMHPVHLKAKHLTPECAGDAREWLNLSDYVTTETNPIWYL